MNRFLLSTLLHEVTRDKLVHVITWVDSQEI